MPPPSFPSSGLLPKNPTQALQFISQHEQFDGRGVIVAILDTGVDPSASGLQSTPDGRPKIIDVQDCSGSGDVMTQKVNITDDDKTITSPFTQRTFSVPEKWTFAQGKEKYVKMGYKRVYELFPSGLVERMKQEAKEKWMLKHNEAEAEANRNLASVVMDAGTSDILLLRKKEMQERVDQLKQARNNYVDYGPILDIITWEDDEGIDRVVLHSTDDTTAATSSLDHHQCLASFRVERQFEIYSASTQMAMCVNTFDHGDIVSVVVDCGAHGTHVAGIVAGYFPNHTELNGVAPGAQIISLKIGDTRLDSMETGTAIARALSAAAAAGADVINMSFGEPTHMPGGGRIVELCRQLVLKHHIVFVASAGNTGPALSTVGAPGGSTPHLIGVSAWVDSEMMVAEYDMRSGETPPATAYTWTARGPTYEGALGVCITAPGGAIACVPRWTLNKKQLMNGTSMASPSAAGGVALLISALKQMNKPRSPARISRALMHTALKLDGVELHAQGHGLMQIANAFDCCMAGPVTSKHLDMAIDVVITSRPQPTNTGYAHGLYLREPWETKCASEHVVEIRPLFDTDEDSPSVGFFVDSSARTSKSDHVDMEIRVRLQVTNPTFVRAPSHILLHSKPHSFKIMVDPTVLPMGSVTFCEILGFDADLDDSTALGPLFRIPITVVIPEPATQTTYRLAFQPGTIYRKFLIPPPGVSWCDVLVRNESFSNPDGRIMALHCLQLRPQSRFREDELEIMQRLEAEPQAQFTKQIKIVPGCTLEVCLAQYWSSGIGVGEISLEIRFYGLTVSPNYVSLSPANGWLSPFTIRADLAGIKVEPMAELNTWLAVVAPVDKTITIAGKHGHGTTRNSVLAAYPPDSRATWELKLTHEFKVDKGQGFKIRFPLALNSMLYDSPLESQMSMVFDADKKLLAVFDYGVANKSTSTVDKHGGGTLTVISIIRYESIPALERLKDMALMVERHLTSPIQVNTYVGLSGPLVGPSQAFKGRLLKRGQELGLCVAPFAVPSSEDMFKKLPSGIQVGDVLSGSIWFASDKGKNKDDAVFAVPLMCVVPPKPLVADKADKRASAPTPSLPDMVKLVIIPTIKGKFKIIESLSTESSNNSPISAYCDTEIKACEAMLNDETTFPSTLADHGDLKAELAVLVLRRAVARQGKVGERLGHHSHDESTLVEFGNACRDVVERSKSLETCLQALDLMRRRRVDLEGISVDPDAGKIQTGTKRLSEALFARAHAYLDVLGTPDCMGVAQLGSEIDIEKELNSTIDIATALVPGGTKDAKFLQLRMRMANKGERWACALALVEALRGEDTNTLKNLPEPTSLHQLLQDKIHLLEKLGWEHMAETARRELDACFPGDWPMF